MNDNTKPAPAGLWCIVTTSPGRTLPLMASLGEAGFEAWTPSETLKRKRPRSNVTVERNVPIAPTFVFVRAVHVRDLAEAEVSAVSAHPRFTIFRQADRIPLVADSEIDGFRRAEQEAHIKARRNKRRRLVMGQRVRLTDGAFAGMCGVVEEGGDKMAVVTFGGFRMRIATWLLSADEVQQYQPVMGAAA